MDISFMDVGTRCWTMKDDCVVECVIVAVHIDAFFGNEQENKGMAVGRIQLLSDESTIESGITYTIQNAKYGGSYFKRLSTRVFESKQALINSL